MIFLKHAPYIRHVDGGKKVILFIHGFLGSPRHFDMFLPFVPDDVAVYNLLLPGHGESALSFGRSSMPAWKSHVNSIMQKLASQYEEIMIVGHSMGTLFAMDAARNFPVCVKQLFLLASPLQIGLKPFAVKNSLKALFQCKDDKDETAKAYADAHSVTLNLRLWEYLTWIPRYLELFQESKRHRKEIGDLSLHCCFYQSEKDELVSPKSVRFIPEKENIRLEILKKSNHFIYAAEDKTFLLAEFQNLFK